MMTILFLLFFFVALFVLVLIRTKSNGKYEVKLTDVIICLIPVVLWLFVTGQISELGIGDLKIKLKEAYQKPVSEELNSLVEGKDLIVVGVDCKYSKEDDIINDTTFPSYRPFKFILIEENCEDDKNGNSDPTFWGILSVEDYRQIFLSPGSKLWGENFIDWVKAKNSKDLQEIVPSFISLDNAVDLKTDKLAALEKMEKLKTDFLPVLDEKNRFLGTVYRERLNSSFLIDIGHALKK
ncbi:hypothetical protein [Runella zeae]|uniref:hypothetical protein n=1 Tax=Runella zeae TaxID=94255 RepID=UPI0023564136|nr:hypothetical protein [Runella zeae]